ncbi:1-deoxy-D-xylulose-5-phosphate reductoisomerase [Alginatibacterium sediminis]|uniref:1-deoxy-D-xylulose 5-phosphate reductoisomerase n=1 Tax=Alginatibacterium sediminis TaxID=2164068 RepID=A0A420E7Q6_9ALTE|nr:1-deoxy-D-xylulose-5-phosphate reductoisomerase [Alginatibacterium sediminis]RKF15506.1 1-deoxy-D-xylulose-5-phosphate reductoisomerase [Alginatibacterium sediminis]
MKSQLVILGATGSIGQSTLKVLRQNLEQFELFGVSAKSSSDTLLKICIEFNPQYAVLLEAKAAQRLKQDCELAGLRTQVLCGAQAQKELACEPEVSHVMAAIVGAAGLEPTLSAVEAGKTILLANKESLVMCGKLFMQQAQRYGAQILPVDSEHNAIFQCLPSAIQNSLGSCELKTHGVSKILLTGSGGPFRNTPVSELAHVTPEQAIAHPNWVMGPKISVDSATMMNKGLEYIEAKRLFNTARDQIQVIVHPQSIIHSMVQYHDGSTLAQLGRPDMATPIANCLAYPERINAGVEALDFLELGELSFKAADFAHYPCLKLAIDACYSGQAATTVLNASNEIAVDAFLNKRLAYLQISQLVDAALQQEFSNTEVNSLAEILALDLQARNFSSAWLNRIN